MLQPNPQDAPQFSLDPAMLQEILAHAAFQQGGLDIHYLERRLGLK
jgi:biotin carboxylase